MTHSSQKAATYIAWCVARAVRRLLPLALHELLHAHRQHARTTPQLPPPSCAGPRAVAVEPTPGQTLASGAAGSEVAGDENEGSNTDAARFFVVVDRASRVYRGGR